MKLLEDLRKFNSNINTIPYGEVMNFAQNLTNNMNTEINKLKNLIKEIKSNYKKFGEKFTIPNTKTIENTLQKNIVFINVSGIIIECIIIEEHTDALKYPYKPCVFSNVPGWFFIAFPELKQILPVKTVDSLFEFRTSIKNTKIHYGLFKDMPLDSTLNSNYAVLPFNKKTWDLFNNCSKKLWPKYMQQINICQLSISNDKSQKIPLFSTNGIKEASERINPENMAVEWSLFVQLYFILYLFAQSGDNCHFSI